MPGIRSWTVKEYKRFRVTNRSSRKNRNKDHQLVLKAHTDISDTYARQHPDMLRGYQIQTLTGSSSECLKVSKGQRLVLEVRT